MPSTATQRVSVMFRCLFLTERYLEKFPNLSQTVTLIPRLWHVEKPLPIGADTLHFGKTPTSEME